MRRSNVTLLFALVALCALPVMADDTETNAAESADMAAGMEAMQKAGAPGEHHQFLAGFEGDWTFTNKVWMEPGKPPMESLGTSSKTMIMGGRYLQEETEGSMMGMSFDGIATTAFDNAAGEFIGTWIDSMSTTMAVVRGQREGDTIEMHGEYLDPMSMQKMKVRYVTKKVDDNKHVFEYFMTMPGGPEVKSMEIEYNRKASE